MADGEAQTTFTIDPQDDAVFVTLHELKQIKEEKDSLDALVQDSMETVDILKRKYDEVKATNHDLHSLIEELTLRYKQAEAERDALQQQVSALQVDCQVSRQAEQLALSHLLQADARLPADVLESSKHIIRTDAEAKQMQNKCMDGIRALTEKACDYLVGLESDHSALLRQFPGLSFERKEEVDPYKGPAKKATHGPAFVFGSPSQRFPMVPQDADPDSGEEEQEQEEEDPSDRLVEDHRSDEEEEEDSSRRPNQ